MIARFNGNVVPFADDSTSTNRTVFGGTTQSDAIDDNLNADFKKGWEIVGLNDNPTREDFNGMGYTLGALTAYLYEMGISEWNTSQNYRANSRVTGSDGKIYKSLTGTTGTPNVGNNPTTDAVNWVAEGSTDYSTLTAKTTPVDDDLIPLSDSASFFGIKKLSWANIKATLKTYFDTLYVALSGNQTIADIKTFTSSPIVPTQTAQDNSTKVATTAYVDGKMVLGTAVNSTSGTSIDFTGIPSWAKKVRIMLQNISLSGSSSIVVQLGSTTIKTSAYNASASNSINGTFPLIISASNGFMIINDVSTDALNAIMDITYFSNNIYMSKHTRGGTTGRTTVGNGAGTVTLDGLLDRIRITTVNGTDTFDAGKINILYEG